MTDEPRPEGPGTETSTPAGSDATAVAGPTGADTEGAPTAAAETAPAEEAGTPPAADEASPESAKLRQTVEIRDVGPCKKHVKVTVDRADIDARLNDKFSELVADANVSGFRPGKAPRRIIERRFQK